MSVWFLRINIVLLLLISPLVAGLRLAECIFNKKTVSGQTAPGVIIHLSAYSKAEICLFIRLGRFVLLALLLMSYWERIFLVCIVWWWKTQTQHVSS
jgi:hypothetical protein